SMSDSPALIDSNILVYAFDKDEGEEYRRAGKLLEQCFLGEVTFSLSLQNISEFFVTITKKISHPVPMDIASLLLKKIIGFNGFVILEPTKKSIVRAVDLCTNKGISSWDAMIAAVMIENQIFEIITENTKDIQKVDMLRVTNPFR
ncbi:PIN domain-containing protein, partial [Candidatus Woesearchaeota archaeon]|nr:PIN domain-containing protein [Candidatus Woesearchaeota archaeon]